MKKILYTLLGISIAIAGSVSAVNVSIPQATQVNQIPLGQSTGNYTPTPFSTVADVWEATKTRWASSSSDYWLTTKSTTNLSEGTNLYFTPYRFVENFVSNIASTTANWGGTWRGRTATTSVNSFSTTSEVPTALAVQTALQEMQTLAKGNFIVGSDEGWKQATTSLFVSSIGQLGIGTITPSYKLDVNGIINTDKNSGYAQNGSLILYASTTSGSTFVGKLSGGHETSGGYNTGLGYGTLNQITTTNRNTAVGAYALANLATGVDPWNATDNTAVGANTGGNLTSGYHNTLMGSGAGALLTTATANTLFSYRAGQNMLDGGENVGIGATSNGYGALYNNQSGWDNTAVGAGAGMGTGIHSASGGTYFGAKTGASIGNNANYNTLLGYESGYDVTGGTNNTIIGQYVTTGAGITTGSNNILIGQGVRSGLSQTGSNQLNIGNLIFGTGLGDNATLSTGNIGVGTTSPATKLSVQGNSYVSGTSFFGGAITATSTLTVAGLTTLGNASTTQLSVSNTAFFPGSGIWNSAGYLGVGTIVPTYNLDVLGAGHLSSYLDASYIVATTSNATSTFNGSLQVNGTTRLATTLTGIAHLVDGYVTSSLVSLTNDITGVLGVSNGGTGQSSFEQGWLSSNGTSLSASTSPTVNYVTATSTTIASTFPYASTTALTVSGSGYFAGNGIWNSAGYLGVGTTTPDARYQVSIQPTAPIGIGVYGGSADYQNGLEFGADSSHAGGVYWRTSGIPRVDITSFNNAFPIEFGNNWMYASSTGIGIGTATPYSRLSVKGKGAGTNRMFELTNSASTSLMYMLENGTTYLKGNVGIGTTSPATALDVNGTTTMKGLTVTENGTSTIPFLQGTMARITTFITTTLNAVTGYFTELFVGGHKVYPRWSDRMSIPQATSTNETMKFGSCLESGGPSVTIDKVDTVIASTTSMTGKEGIAWNIKIANSTASGTPMTLFTSTKNTYSTTTQTYTTEFSTATIPSGYCYWFAPTIASTTQIQQMYLNIWGYEI